MKINVNNSVLFIKLEDESEKKIIDLLYGKSLIKGAFEYKANDFVKIDMKAYSSEYKLSDRYANKVKKKKTISEEELKDLFN